MKARTIAGWIALISGGLLVVAIAGSAVVAGTGGSANTSAFNWMMGGGRGTGYTGAFGMGPGHVGSGMGGKPARRDG